MADSRPSLVWLGCEPIRAALELASSRLRPPRDAAGGDGHPVVVFPGLGANEWAMRILRDHCRRSGYDTLDWGRGFNTGPQGDVEAWLQQLATDVGTLLAGRAQPASLVGWSLGGLYARELAKRMPGRVRQVITIGTPFNAGARRTNAGWLYRVLNGAPVEVDALLARRLRTPPPVPTTSIYSRSDGVVPWRACVHRGHHERVRDIEVGGSHLGMGWNREVLDIVRGRLADVPAPL